MTDKIDYLQRTREDPDNLGNLINDYLDEKGITSYRMLSDAIYAEIDKFEELINSMRRFDYIFFPLEDLDVFLESQRGNRLSIVHFSEGGLFSTYNKDGTHMSVSEYYAKVPEDERLDDDYLQIGYELLDAVSKAAKRLNYLEWYFCGIDSIPPAQHGPRDFAEF